MNNNTSQNNILNRWKQVKLRELTVKIGSGVTPKGGSKVYSKQGVKFLRSQNIRNGYLDLKDIVYISNEIDNRMKLSRVIKDDILYNITGASIGRSAVYLLNEYSNVNQHVCIIRLIVDNPKFINAFLLSRKGIGQLYSFQAGGNREGLNFKQLGSFKLLLPPLPEQNRIVAVLEVWDQAIEKLTRKIELKQNVKKGLMQQLLTPPKGGQASKLRLPGFTGEWRTVKLGDVCRVIMGQSPSSIAYNKLGNGLPLVQGNNDIKNRKTIARIWTSEITKIANVNDIIMTVRAPVGCIGLATQKACIGRGVCSIIPESIDNIFILKFLEYYESNWKSLEQGSTFTAVNSSDIKSLKIKVPISKNEQTAIATILTAADNEITVLEKQLAFLKEQKKYLLNNLVTGRIRVPEDLLDKKKASRNDKELSNVK